MRTPLAFLAAATGLLAACGTPEQLAYHHDPVLAMSEEYGPACGKGGYPKGSQQWRHCIVQTSTWDDLIRQGLYFDRYMQWYWMR